MAPAQPSHVLRGHAAHIHSVRFVRHNSRLLTGDADGWVVCWHLASKRPLAVWKAHHGALLATDEWGCNVVTHGRDHRLRIWQLPLSDHAALSTLLPAQDAHAPRPKPWLLHALPVNTLNFCAFSMCSETASAARHPPQAWPSEDQPARNAGDPILVATPAADDKKINVYQFPDERLRYVVPGIVAADTGMVMALKILHHHTSGAILVLSGYEGGLTAVHRLPPTSTTLTQDARLVYLSQPHTQPVLSLDASPRGHVYFTSSADAIVAAHCIPELDKCMHHTGHDTPPDVAPETARQETLDAAFTAPEVHDDQKQDAPVLQQTPISFAKQAIVSSQAPSPKAAGLCSLLSVGPHQATPQPPSLRPERISIQHPHKVNSTKHAGQQSLRLRSDGRIFATGGWDSRIRIYSSKTLKEVAVLKWHKEGVYAVDFAQVLEARHLQRAHVPKETGLGKLQHQRDVQMQLKHWIVAGAKDGKISLWELF